VQSWRTSSFLVKKAVRADIEAAPLERTRAGKAAHDLQTLEHGNGRAVTDCFVCRRESRRPATNTTRSCMQG
jgi:hypothetical protein